MEAKIVIKYDDGKIAEAITEAVSPDNFKTPRGLLVNTERSDNEVLTRIECETKLSTFIATIDDLLSYISIAEKTLQTTKKLK